ncbi:hypothetical protein [Hydrocarboniphaga sp.]|uniref:hypothetical protein n=1 Tax=Hydrocarboniphaga sp. TaxID=2033016 RepID=UPI002603A0A7|nr:hypothetical protein [Hydrocarboniphaga sp.]
MSAMPAHVAGLADRGVLAVGKAANLIVYDFEGLWIKGMEYKYRYDMPNKDWRRYLPTGGYRYTVVNGELTLEDGKPTGALPGAVLRVTTAQATAAA